MKHIYLLAFVIFAIFTSAYAEDEAKYTRPSNDTIKRQLSPIQYQVTQQKGTEPAFDNLYWDNKKPGIYVDIVSGEPLFSSTDKYDSGTGWPSFTKPLIPGNIILMTDNGLIIPRTEVISKHGLSHLGHVFEDGPLPSHKRYCMNSAALKFIPVDEMKKKGYGKYLYLFEDAKIQNAANH